ncbi:MAG: nitroreductase family protein [Eubacteriaceae bacterium]
MKEIFERTSCRSFKDFPVDAEDTEQLLRAAMQAPSMGNQQPWEFLVVTDHEMMKKLSGVDTYAKYIAQTPEIIIIAGNKKEMRFPETWMMDCSAAAENMLIEARSLGLGAYWFGIAQSQERIDFVRSLFQMPETIVPFALIGVGKMNRYTKPEDRFDESRIHREVW